MQPINMTIRILDDIHNGSEDSRLWAGNISPDNWRLIQDYVERDTPQSDDGEGVDYYVLNANGLELLRIAGHEKKSTEAVLKQLDLFM